MKRITILLFVLSFLYQSVKLLKITTVAPPEDFQVESDDTLSFEDDDEGLNFDELNKAINMHSSRQARWSYFTQVGERVCAANCRQYGKPFGRLVGARCQCLCPVNAGQFGLCNPGGGTKNCFQFCQRVGYPAGGGCLYNGFCFCFCGHLQPYNASIVYTTPSPNKR